MCIRDRLRHVLHSFAQLLLPGSCLLLVRVGELIDVSKTEEVVAAVQVDARRVSCKQLLQIDLRCRGLVTVGLAVHGPEQTLVLVVRVAKLRLQQLDLRLLVCDRLA
eukprot:5307088-Pyramimonas_sp.AAC.1